MHWLPDSMNPGRATTNSSAHSKTTQCFAAQAKRPRCTRTGRMNSATLSLSCAANESRGSPSQRLQIFHEVGFLSRRQIQAKQPVVVVDDGRQVWRASVVE